MNKQDVLDYLNTNQIKYDAYEHEAVYTCSEAEIHCKNIPGISAKSLLVKAKDQFYLCLVPANKKLDSKGLETIVGIKKIRFALPEELMELLKLTPGSVSPFGLINDTTHRVKLLIDDAISRSEYVQFHPNINTSTLALTQNEFQKFLDAVKVEKKVEKLTV